jgi:hypothetical protein
MVKISFGGDRSLAVCGTESASAAQPPDRCWVSGVPENAAAAVDTSAADAPRSQSARGARRRSKNCGGGIVPAAIGALIEAGHSSVNAFPISLRLPEALGWRL